MLTGVICLGIPDSKATFIKSSSLFLLGAWLFYLWSSGLMHARHVVLSLSCVREHHCTFKENNFVIK